MSTRLPDWFDTLADASAPLLDALTAGRRAVATGSAGSSTALIAAALAVRASRPVVLTVAHLDDADECRDELESLGVPVTRLPALEVLPGETAPATDLLGERLAAVRAASTLDPQSAHVVVAPIQALMQAVPGPDRMGEITRRVTPGARTDPSELIQWLASVGYDRVDAVEEPAQFAVRGGIVDVFPPGGGEAVRMDFFGDELDRLSAIDLETMGSDRALVDAELVAADVELLRARDGDANYLELLPQRCLALLAETLEVTEQGRGYYERATDSRGLFGPPAVLQILSQRFGAFAEVNQFSAGAADADVRIDLPVAPLPQLSSDAAEAVGELGELALRTPVRVVCQNDAEKQRCGELIGEFAQESARDRITAEVGYVHRGFAVESSAPVAVVPYHELLGRFHARRRATRLRAGRAMDTFLEFKPGDYVVHAEHGIARFAGLTMMKPERLGSVGRKQERDAAEQEEFLTLEFAGSTRLHVPAIQIDLVQRYVGGFSGKPPLSAIGGKRWKNQKEKVTESVRDLAAEMLRVRAGRESIPGTSYPADTKWQKEFEAEFPYDETEDQLASLIEIKRDMQAPRPMDRLICGDVGFGKTEVAIRAAFKACEFGKQVAVLVPTTVLAEQHERTFRARFADYPFKVESLSRFKTTKEVNNTLAKLRKGQVDVIVGTHRLLSKDVRFADLGLVVIDEEQRFGVEHKERLLHLRMTVDVLTLSATPIPRTLHMSMLGLRDISSLTTPPLDRRAVVTEVIPYNGRRIKQAIEREMAREGQVFFVHNRVHNIERVKDDLLKLVPDAKIVIGHGQMAPKDLERVMLGFMRREYDVLLSTTIIESGIDIPTANTMFINDADRFGLADLHQLRGRVGRYKHRAYCYMLLPADRTVKEVAQKRLKAIEQYSMLGAGFKIAMRDLEIRGAGNLLGAEQSGHIATVGYEMYCQLLEDEVKRLKNERVTAPPSSTKLDIGAHGLIPKPYIPSDARRMDAYRRLATATTGAELDTLEEDLREAYGEPPELVRSLIELSRVRAGAATLGVRAVTVREGDVVFRCDEVEPVEAALQGVSGSVRALPPKQGETATEIYWRPPPSYLEPGSLMNVLRKRLA